jgi:hypothetical protein
MTPSLNACTYCRYKTNSFSKFTDHQIKKHSKITRKCKFWGTKKGCYKCENCPFEHFDNLPHLSCKWCGKLDVDNSTTICYTCGRSPNFSDGVTAGTYLTNHNCISNNYYY